MKTAATLTLVLGVAGGLYLDESKHEQAAAKETAAKQAKLDSYWTEYAQWSQGKAAQENMMAQAAKAAEDARKAAAEAANRTSRTTVNVPKPTINYPIPASCSEYTGNRGIGCGLMLEAGYGLDQMPCLEKLWTKESGWNEKSANGSGAYGIPQALPGSKMSTYGSDWQTNPITQIKWGLNYIRSKYGDPCGAWSVWQSKGWY